jgi:thiol-disulfide isomerase/thioredoxin
MALTFTPLDELGNLLPDFSGPSVREGIISSKHFQTGQPLLVMFICNHCPYVKAIEDRLIQLAIDLKEISVQTLAICSNDPSEAEEDSFENLKKRALEKNYPFPYMHDESQKVAQEFGAVCTPDFFLYDKDLKLAYRGRLDDSWKDPSKVSRRELFNAAKILAEGKKLTEKQTPSMGCNIKWK